MEKILQAIIITLALFSETFGVLGGQHVSRLSWPGPFRISLFPAPQHNGSGCRRAFIGFPRSSLAISSLADPFH